MDVSNYTVNFVWDDEACVWIAASDDIPGLALESGSFDALLERVRIGVPELLSLNTFSNQEIEEKPVRILGKVVELRRKF